MGIFNRKERLYPIIQIALHHIGAAEKQLLSPAIVEVEDPTMFQKAAYDAAHTNILADPRDARPQAADTPHNQLYPHPGLRSLIELVNDLRIDQGIQLKDQQAVAVLASQTNLPFDALQNAAAQT